jgi:hypothetical protein
MAVLYYFPHSLLPRLVLYMYSRRTQAIFFDNPLYTLYQRLATCSSAPATYRTATRVSRKHQDERTNRHTVSYYCALQSCTRWRLCDGCVSL